jgi:hypothetical protein
VRGFNLSMIMSKWRQKKNASEDCSCPRPRFPYVFCKEKLFLHADLVRPPSMDLIGDPTHKEHCSEHWCRIGFGHHRNMRVMPASFVVATKLLFVTVIIEKPSVISISRNQPFPGVSGIEAEEIAKLHVHSSRIP